MSHAVAWAYGRRGTHRPGDTPVRRASSDTGGRTAVDRRGAQTQPLRTRSARDDRGFTIIESLTAATILLIISVVIVSVLITTGGWYAKATVRTQAATVANQVMSIILSRNYGDLHYATTEELNANKKWPAIIPQEMVWPTTIGDFSVETSLTPTTDPATGLEMKRITVMVNPVRNALDTPVSIIRYASGWQGMASDTGVFKVPVHVQCSVAKQGIRVELLDAGTMTEARYAITDPTGLAVFTDVVERPEGYFLTSDPRTGLTGAAGIDVRPVHFPTRIFPTHGGSANNPILSINTYTLEVVNSSTPAILRVGAYRRAGWRFLNEANGTMNWVSTDIPYRPVYGLTVYAKPTLNTTTDNGIYGLGDLSRYPDNTNMVYKGTVNAYGVATIEIPWTTDPSEGQYWTIWTTTQEADGSLSRHVKIDQATGGWNADVKIPDLPSTGAYTEAPQWEHLGDAVTPYDDPTPQTP